MFEKAAVLFEQSGAPFEAARAKLDLARALLACGRADAAEREAGTAIQSFQKLGAAHDEERARQFSSCLA